MPQASKVISHSIFRSFLWETQKTLSEQSWPVLTGSASKSAELENKKATRRHFTNSCRTHLSSPLRLVDSHMRTRSLWKIDLTLTYLPGLKHYTGTFLSSMEDWGFRKITLRRIKKELPKNSTALSHWRKWINLKQTTDIKNKENNNPKLWIQQCWCLGSTVPRHRCTGNIIRLVTVSFTWFFKFSPTLKHINTQPFWRECKLPLAPPLHFISQSRPSPNVLDSPHKRWWQGQV